MARAFNKFLPLMDRVLVERFLPELKTKSGLMIPEKSQGKVVQGTIVACGPGSKTKDGVTIPLSVKSGDVVLLPEYGGTKVELDKKEYYLFRDSDILGKFES
ncbi:10 kDa heat shock protein, mitochondrial-like [Argonauta hians]